VILPDLLQVSQRKMLWKSAPGIILNERRNMNPNPFKSLLHSRKFWLLILDMVVSTLTLVLTQVLLPEQLDFALKLIAIYQPVFVFIITSIAIEDAALNKNGQG
jgi:hypothetical protein